MLGGGTGLLPYLNGLFAGLGSCVLPVLSVMIVKRNKLRFIGEFFIAQLAVFLAVALAFSAAYNLVEWSRPFLLLIASFVTFYSAFSIYTGAKVPVPASGALYGLALSPCSIGFVTATASTSFGWIEAVINAFLFSLGTITPLTVVAFILQGTDNLVRHGKWIERTSVLLLLLVSYYLAYLAGSSWRWIP